MTAFTGHAEVDRLKRNLDNAFARFDLLPEDELELRSDFARYLCVFVSGFMERAIRELVIEGCRQQASEKVVRFVKSRLDRFQNAKADRVATLVGAFSSVWRDELEEFYQNGGKAALDSVVALRNSIAHGDPVGVTYSTITDYYAQILTVIDHIGDRFCPVA